MFGFCSVINRARCDRSGAGGPFDVAEKQAKGVGE